MARWIVPRGTTTQLDGLTSISDGEIAYNSELKRFQMGLDGGWVTVVGTDGIVDENITDDTISLAKIAADTTNTGEILVRHPTSGAVISVDLENNQVLTKDSSGAFVSSVVDNDLIPDNSINYAKLVDIAEFQILTTDTGEVTPSGETIEPDTLVGRTGTGKITGSKLQDNQIPINTISHNKLSNVPPATILGARSAGSDISEAAVTAIGADDVREILGIAAGSIDQEAKNAISATSPIAYSSSTGVISHTAVGTVAANVVESDLSYLSGITFDAHGHVQSTDTQQISAGNQIDISTTGEISHEDVTAGANISESSLTYMSGITMDGNGHVTSTDSQGISAGDWISISNAGVISHAAVTEGADVDASGHTYVNKVLIDNYGHVTETGTGTIPNASTSVTGVASFNSTDFDVTSGGAVSLSESKIYGDFNASGNGLDYNSTGTFSHADTSSISDISEEVNTGGDANIKVLTSATFDEFGHVQTMGTETLEDGDNIVFDHSTSGTVEISVPRASTSTRGAAQFNSGDFSVDTNGLVSLGSINGGTMIDASSVSYSRLPKINNFGFLGSDETGSTDTEVLTPENVLDLLNLNVGNGLEFNETDNTINVQNLAFSNNYVHTTQAVRNADTSITWHPGDISITTNDGGDNVAETWLYIGADGTAGGSITNADFVETTQNPTNLAATPSTTAVVVSSSTGSDATISSATSSAAGVMTAADKSKLNGIEASANNYKFNLMADGDSSAGEILNDETLTITATGAAAVARSGDTLTISATNTTYGAGGGLDLTGTVFSHSDTSSQSSVNNSGTTVIQDITIDGYGHITGIGSATLTDTDTTYSGGTGISVSGTTISHSDTSSQASVNNSGRTVIQDITLDSFGHLTGINSVTLADTDTDNYVNSASFNTGNGILTLGRSGSLSNLTVDLDGRYSTSGGVTYSAGTGISISGTTISNSAPDRTVSITGGGATSVTGTYPNFTITSTDTDTNTNTTYSAGTGLSLNGTTFNVNDIYLRNNANDSTSGTLTAADFCVSSDRRLKDNIVTIENGLDKVNAMRGVEYDIAGMSKVGVIAQEMEEVIPSAVHTNGSGMKSVAYGNLVGVLIEAVKELTARVEELENGSK